MEKAVQFVRCSAGKSLFSLSAQRCSDGPGAAQAATLWGQQKAGMRCPLPLGSLGGHSSALGHQEGAWGQPRKGWQVLGTAGAHGHGDDWPPAALQGGCRFWLL